MDPTESGEPPQPTEEKKASPAKKIVVITSITLGVLALIVGAVVLFNYMASRDVSESATDPNIRVEREGYANLDTLIGDPSAIVQSAGEEPVQYQDVAVVDACNLLTLDMVRQQNLLIAPSVVPGEVSRHYFDGSSEFIEKTWQAEGTLTRELNDCSYPLVNSEGEQDGSLYVAVYQPTYASPAGIRNMVDDYLRSDPIGDVERYNRVNTPIQDDRTFYLLRKDDVYVSVEFNLNADTPDEVMRTMLEAIAGRLGEAAKQANGPARYGYESQTFSGNYVSACDISDASDITLLFDKPASPSIQERLATATGVISHDGVEDNFISNQCVRRTAGERPAASTLTIEVNSYDNEAAAKAYLDSQRNDSSLVTDTTIGDETFFSASGLLNNALYFRIGATTIALSPYETMPNEMTAEERIERLLPVAQAIVDRMNGEDEANEPIDPATEAPAPKNEQS